MEIAITTLHIHDYDAVMALWNQCEGIGLSEADSRESIQSYLDRNPGRSPATRYLPVIYRDGQPIHTNGQRSCHFRLASP